MKKLRSRIAYFLLVLIILSNDFGVFANAYESINTDGIEMMVEDAVDAFSESAAEPTVEPTNEPTDAPSDAPTSEPTDEPTNSPSDVPTAKPTDEPTDAPSDTPTSEPTDEPTDAPSDMPTSEPTDEPTDASSDTPTSEPTDEPTDASSDTPTSEPTDEPTDAPSDMPTSEPTDEPTEIPLPTLEPTEEPSAEPTGEPTPVPVPTLEPLPTIEPGPEITEEPLPVPTPLSERLVNGNTFIVENNESFLEFINFYNSGTFEEFIDLQSLIVALSNNIDISADPEFLGIGTIDKPFQSIFEGTGFSINLSSGLFNYASGAVIRNVKVTGSVNAAGNTGGIVSNALNGTVIENCINDTFIFGNDGTIGGIAGVVDSGSSIVNSVNNGMVRGTDDNVGGIAGILSQNSNISGSNNYGTVAGHSYVGGIAGRSLTGSVISGVTNSASLTSSNGYVGGITGHALGTEINESVNSGTVTSGNNYIGGLAGYSDGTKIIASENQGTVSNGSYLGGLVGYGKNGTVISGSKNNGTVAGGSFIGGIAGQLESNSSVTDSEVGSVTVSGGAYLGGIVGIMIDSKIERVRVYSAVTKGSYAGGMTGQMLSGSIKNAEVWGDVTGYDRTGGIVGELNNGFGTTSLIEDSVVYGNVTGGSNSGGAVGYISGNNAGVKLSRVYYSGEQVQISSGGLFVCNVQPATVIENSGYYVKGRVEPSDASILINDVYDESQITRSSDGSFTVKVLVSSAVGAPTVINNTVDTVSFAASGYTTEKIYLSESNAKLKYNLNVGSVVMETSNAEEDITGEGTEASPFVIENEEQFLFMTSAIGMGGKIKGASASTSSYKLSSDIDISDEITFFGIGNLTYPFKGVFDGGGHSIKLNINSTVEDNVGLFRAINGAEINNLTVAGSVKGRSYVGGIVGRSLTDSVISGVTNGASVTSSNGYVGGITGHAIGTEIKGSVNNGAVTPSGYTYSGGIVGFATASTVISGSKNNGSVTSGTYVGGIAGWLEKNSAIIDSEVGLVTVTGGSHIGCIVGVMIDSVIERVKVYVGATKGSLLGGIAGQMLSGSIKNAEVWGDVTGYDRTGGIVGELNNGFGTTSLIEDSVVYGNVTGGSNSGGAVGYISGNNAGVKLSRVYYSGEQVQISSGGLFVCNVQPATVIENSGYYVKGRVEPSDASILINDVVCEESQITRGLDGIFTVKVPVSSAVGASTVLNNTVDTVSFAASGYKTEKIYLSENNQKLKYDLDVGSVVMEASNAEESITGEGTEESPFVVENEEQFMFMTSAIGMGGEIKGAPANTSSYKLSSDIDISDETTFFGIGNLTYPFKGTFDGDSHSIKLNINSTVEDNVGLFRAINGAEINNLTVTGSVRGRSYVGGITGRSLTGSVISGVINGASVTSSNNYVGGITGNALGTEIKESVNSGTVTSSGVSYLGGLVGCGTNDTVISGSKNNGTVTGGNFIGGIAGSLEGNSSITDSEVGSVTVSGGAYLGGIVGMLTDSKIERVKVYGVVTIGSLLGGITGQMLNGSIKNAEVWGDVSGYDRTGGIVGYMYVAPGKTALIEDSVMYGNVTGTSNSGGAVGLIDSKYTGITINRVYYAGDKVHIGSGGVFTGYIQPNTVIENSGYYVKGRVEPSDVSILINDVYDESQITRSGDGSFTVKVSVSSTVGSATAVNNTVETVSFAASGYTTEKIYLSENNQKLKYDLNVGSVVMETSNVEESIEGEGTEESPFVIENEEQFLFMTSVIGMGGKIKGVSSGTANYALAEDVDLSAASTFFGIGNLTYPFKGTFDGCGHSIKLNITSTVEDNVGLFRAISGAEINNLTVTGSVKGRIYVGGITGRSLTGSVIAGVTNDTSVTSSNGYVGGITGHALGTEINGSVNNGAVTPSGYTYSGGIAGFATSSTVISGSKNNGSVTSGTYVGGIVGWLEKNSAIIDSEVGSVTVSGGSYVGGAAGYSADSKIERVKVYGTVIKSNCAGGIAGHFTNGHIRNAEVWGDIIGYDRTGGIVGELYNSSGTTALIEDSVVYGNVTGTSRSGGAIGLVDSNYTGITINRVYYSGEQVQISSGGLLVCNVQPATVIENSGYYIKGRVEPSDASILINDVVCDESQITRSSDGSFTVKVPVSSAAGSATAVNNTIDTVSFASSGYVTEKIYLSENNAKLKYDLDVGSVVMEASNTEEGITGEGTEESPFVVENEEQFMFMTSIVGMGGKIKGVSSVTASYTLTADLDLSTETTFFGIGNLTYPFKGRFDGNGHSIKLNINSTIEDNVGLFRAMSGAEINNLTVTGSVKGRSYVGGIAGRSLTGSIISDGTNSASVTSSSNYVGGITGHALGTEIIGSVNSGAVNASGYSYIGGLVGHSDGTKISTSENKGTVSNGSYLGGLVGFGTNATVLSKVKNIGTVTGGSYVGGIVGQLEKSSSITESEVGSVSISGYYEYTGGIAGYSADSNIDRVKAYGTVLKIGNYNYTGGIVGYLNNGNIKFAEVWGKVTGKYDTGGIAGVVSADSGKKTAIEDSVVYEDVTGLSNTGGVIGYIASNGVGITVNRVYYAGNEVQISSGGVFVGYVQPNTVIENSGYYIKGQVEPSDVSILINDVVCEESQLTRSGGGSFTVKVPVSSAVGSATVINNIVDTVSFAAPGYTPEKIYLSENNANLKYNLNVGIVVMEASNAEESITGEGTEESPFVIENEEQFLFMTSVVGMGGKVKGVSSGTANYTLATDLDLSAVSTFFGIGNLTYPFKGVFDGVGHSINLNITSTVEDNVGLFRAIGGAEIKDITVTGVVKGRSYVGGITGRSLTGSVITGVTNSASVTSSNGYVGGITGHAIGTEIKESANSGAVTPSGYGYSGGIAGVATASTVISGSKNNGSVTSGNYVGGIAGWLENNSSITDGEVGLVTVTGGICVGGIAGIMTDSVIERVKVYGSVTKSNCAGGIAGYFTNGHIKNAEVWGDVTGGASTGGIVGELYNGSVKTTLIEDSVVYGNVTGTGNSGGAVGYISSNYSGVRMSRVYYSGEKVQINSGGVFVGYVQPNTLIENSGYYIKGQVKPSDAAILINDVVYDESRITRGGDGSFTVKVPVSSAVGSATAVNNTVDTVSFAASGYMTEKIYLSENNQKLKYDLNVGSISIKDGEITEVEPVEKEFLDIKVISPSTALFQKEISLITSTVPSEQTEITIEIETHETATWKLYGDSSCTNEIETHNLPLVFGTNRAFIKVTNSEGYSKVYTLVINREAERSQSVTNLNTISRPNEIQLNWNMAYESSVKSYNIYKSNSPNSGFWKYARVSGRATLTYTDKSVAPGATYYYKVSTVNEAGVESYLSASVKGVAGIYSSPPVIIGMTPLTDSVVGKKTAINVKAEDFMGLSTISLQYLQDGEWITLEKRAVSGTSASVIFNLGKLTSGGKITFRAFAVNSGGFESEDNPVRTYELDVQGAGKITGLTATSAINTVTLRWQDVIELDFAYFGIEQKNPDGTFKRIATENKTLGYHVLNLQPKTEYTFRVNGYDIYDNPGEYSEEVTVTTSADEIFPIVTSVRPLSGFYSTSVPVSVTATDNVGVSDILIETSTDQATWKQQSLIVINPHRTSASVSQTVYINNVPEGPLFIRAFAMDIYGNKSYSSAVVEHRIDRTAPSAPTGLSVTNNTYAITVKWNQGTEKDLRSYSIYRSTNVNGPYTRISYNLNTLGYIDRNVTFGTAYYYKSTATDQAGNESAQSSAILGTLLADTELPIIHSIDPVRNASVGVNPTIRVLAQDKVGVASITAEYQNGEEWITIGNVNASGDSYVGYFVWNNKDLPGGKKNLRFFALDKNGNNSGYFNAVYDVKNQQPKAAELTATPEDWKIILTWEPVDAPDIYGYQLYRKEPNGTNRLLKTYGLSTKTYIYTDEKLDPEKEYSYFVQVYDKYNNTSTGATVTATPLEGDPYPPVAEAGFGFNIPIGMEASFDATASADNDMIATYLWDFGDGQTAAEARVTHVYETVGTYEATLTVTDRHGNESKDNLTVKAMSPLSSGNLTVRVLDKDTGLPLSNASVYVDLPGEPLIDKTNSNGELTVTAAPGEYKVAAYLKDYLPHEEIFKVTQNATEKATLRLTNGELIVGRIEHRRLSLQEISALGADVNSPENKHVYTFDIQLMFKGYPLDEFEFTINGLGRSIGPKLKIPLEDGSKVIVVPIPKPNHPEIPPTIAFLKMSGSTSFLKEFFEVSVIMQNMADPQFELVNNTVTLNLPSGLALAPMVGEKQTLSRTIDVIAGGQEKSVSWIVRGDIEGSYDLSADFIGTLMPFREEVRAKFITDPDNPLVVNGSKGLKMKIQPRGIVLAGQDFHMGFEIVNESDIPFYMVTVGFDGTEAVPGKAYKLKSKDSGVPAVDEPEKILVDKLPLIHDGDSVTVEELLPGESIKGMYVTKFEADLSDEELIFFLSEMFVQISEKKTDGVPTEVLPPVPLYELPEDVEWQHIEKQALDTELIVTTEKVETFGIYSDCLVAVLHDLSSQDKYAYKALVLDNNKWKIVGYLDKDENALPVGSETFSTFAAPMPMTSASTKDSFGDAWNSFWNKIHELIIKDFENDVELTAKQGAVMSLVPEAVFTSEELKEIQTKVYEMKRDKIFALEDLYWALTADDPTELNTILYGYGGGPFGYIRYESLKGVEIIGKVQSEGISARGKSTYNYNDELAWEVDVAGEYALYKRSCEIADTKPLSMDEFVSIASLFWQADAVTRLQDKVEALGEALKVAGGIALTAAGLAAVAFEYAPLVSGAFSKQSFNFINSTNFSNILMTNSQGEAVLVSDAVGMYAGAVAVAGVGGIALQSLSLNQVNDLTSIVTKVRTASSSGGVGTGKGFNTFDELKKEIGPAGEGKAWHHIVEQSQITKSGFDPKQIHNTSNVISISSDVHAKISGYYNTTKFPFTSGLSVRDWLAGQSFTMQFDFGLKVLKDFEVIK